MTGVDLAAIRARADAATKGPWHTEVEPGHSGADIYDAESALPLAGAFAKVDAEFIAAARSDVPLLVAEVERLREQLQAVLDLADQWERDYNRAAHVSDVRIDAAGAASEVRAAVEGAGS